MCKNRFPLTHLNIGLVNFVFLLLTGLMSSLTSAAENEWPTEKGYFMVTYEPATNPIPLNQIHEWTLLLQTPDGAPVSDAVIEAKGGMPEHNHGLPTDPEVVPGDIPGFYILKGLRFHMMGYWEITLSVEAEGIKDTLVITLAL